MKIIVKQIRTCITCRKQFNQHELLRLQCINKALVKFTKCGRSFYLCEECLVDEKRTIKALYRQCKNKADYKIQLKEIGTIWKTK